MSIPNPFRPVCGTLGGVSIEVPTGYVSPDVFWLDARAQGDGLTTSMIDIVGMRRIALSTGGLYIADGVARGDIYIDEAPHARNSNYAVELVFACNPGANGVVQRKRTRYWFEHISIVRYSALVFSPGVRICWCI